jgi:hypothetical protein
MGGRTGSSDAGSSAAAHLSDVPESPDGGGPPGSDRRSGAAARGSAGSGDEAGEGGGEGGAFFPGLSELVTSLTERLEQILSAGGEMDAAALHSTMAVAAALAASASHITAGEGASAVASGAGTVEPTPRTAAEGAQQAAAAPEAAAGELGAAETSAEPEKVEGEEAAAEGEGLAEGKGEEVEAGEAEDGAATAGEDEVDQQEQQPSAQGSAEEAAEAAHEPAPEAGVEPAAAAVADVPSLQLAPQAAGPVDPAAGVARPSVVFAQSGAILDSEKALMKGLERYGLFLIPRIHALVLAIFADKTQTTSTRRYKHMHPSPQAHVDGCPLARRRLRQPPRHEPGALDEAEEGEQEGGGGARPHQVRRQGGSLSQQSLHSSFPQSLPSHPLTHNHHNPSNPPTNPLNPVQSKQDPGLPAADRRRRRERVGPRADRGGPGPLIRRRDGPGVDQAAGRQDAGAAQRAAGGGGRGGGGAVRAARGRAGRRSGLELAGSGEVMDAAGDVSRVLVGFTAELVSKTEEVQTCQQYQQHAGNSNVGATSIRIYRSLEGGDELFAGLRQREHREGVLDGCVVGLLAARGVCERVDCVHTESVIFVVL